MPGILKGILENGLPAGLTSASGAVGGILANRILTASAAGMYVVAFSVHKSAGSLMGVIYMCVADAVWTLSGIYYGEEDVGALRELQRAAIRKGLLFNTAAAGMFFLFFQVHCPAFCRESGWGDAPTGCGSRSGAGTQSAAVYAGVHLQKLSDGHRTQTGSESVQCSFGVSRSCLLCFPDGLYAGRKGSVDCDTG